MASHVRIALITTFLFINSPTRAENWLATMFAVRSSGTDSSPSAPEASSTPTTTSRWSYSVVDNQNGTQQAQVAMQQQVAAVEQSMEVIQATDRTRSLTGWPEIIQAPPAPQPENLIKNSHANLQNESEASQVIANQKTTVLHADMTHAQAMEALTAAQKHNTTTLDSTKIDNQSANHQSQRQPQQQHQQPQIITVMSHELLFDKLAIQHNPQQKTLLSPSNELLIYLHMAVDRRGFDHMQFVTFSEFARAEMASWKPEFWQKIISSYTDLLRLAPDTAFHIYSLRQFAGYEMYLRTLPGYHQNFIATYERIQKDPAFAEKMQSLTQGWESTGDKAKRIIKNIFTRQRIKARSVSDLFSNKQHLEQARSVVAKENAQSEKIRAQHRAQQEAAKQEAIAREQARISAAQQAQEQAAQQARELQKRTDEAMRIYEAHKNKSVDSTGPLNLQNAIETAADFGRGVLKGATNATAELAATTQEAIVHPIDTAQSIVHGITTLAGKTLRAFSDIVVAVAPGFEDVYSKAAAERTMKRCEKVYELAKTGLDYAEQMDSAEWGEAAGKLIVDVVGFKGINTACGKAVKAVRIATRQASRAELILGCDARLSKELTTIGEKLSKTGAKIEEKIKSIVGPEYTPKAALAGVDAPIAGQALKQEAEQLVGGGAKAITGDALAISFASAIKKHLNGIAELCGTKISDIQHIFDRHIPGGKDVYLKPNTSLFLKMGSSVAQTEEILQYCVQAWHKGTIVEQSVGKVAKICDMGKVIGIDKFGNPTSKMKIVVVKDCNRIITAYPVH